MGANMTRRLLRDDHEVIGFDLDREAVREIENVGAGGAETLEALVEQLEPARLLDLTSRSSSKRSRVSLTPMHSVRCPTRKKHCCVTSS
jgi:6-phosphogluconate dehydrogenase (decarboxylating)